MVDSVAHRHNSSWFCCYGFLKFSKTLEKPDSEAIKTNQTTLKRYILNPDKENWKIYERYLMIETDADARRNLTFKLEFKNSILPSPVLYFWLLCCLFHVLSVVYCGLIAGKLKSLKSHIHQFTTHPAPCTRAKIPRLGPGAWLLNL